VARGGGGGEGAGAGVGAKGRGAGAGDCTWYVLLMWLAYGVRMGTGRLTRGSFTAPIGIAEVVDVAAKKEAAAVATAQTPRLRRCASYDRAIALHRPPRPVMVTLGPAVAMAPPLPLPWPPQLPLPMRRCASLDDAARWGRGGSTDCPVIMA